MSDAERWAANMLARPEHAELRRSLNAFVEAGRAAVATTNALIRLRAPHLLPADAD